MAARKKSAARKKKSAAKKKPAKAGRPRRAAKKAAGKKTAARRERTVAVRTPVAMRPMDSAAVMAIDERIAIVRANLRELVDQAASSAGAANEELMSQRISQQEERLRLLTQERDGLIKRGS